MPELPDITVYVEALGRVIRGRALERVRTISPSLLRTWDPPLSALNGRTVCDVGHLAKRIVIHFEDDLYVVIHLMIAGRFQWVAKRAAPLPRRIGHAAFDFENGTLILTEAGTRKRAGLWVLRGADAVAAQDRGGIDPLSASTEDFSEALRRENRTLKRALTDPRILGGIGNAYSDEILWRAQLSPVRRTQQLSTNELHILHAATVATLREWIDRLRTEAGDGFPAKVTAFRPEMAVHGRYRKPCPRCGSPVQRIVYASNETNYCATCQTGGRLLADRALSRLLGEDWPRSLEDLEELTS
ncbi:MAG TPA: DNA-formamidopyrimidine glycosylase family protein [Longimicrobiales bacterium]